MEHELIFWACLIITNIWVCSNTPKFGFAAFWFALALLAAFVP